MQVRLSLANKTLQQQSTWTSGLRWILNAPFDLIGVVARRLWSHFAMMLALAVGFTVAIALVVAIPVYAEAVGYRVLKAELSRRDDGSSRPPFAFMYRYLGSTNSLIGWDAYAKLDRYMTKQMPQQIGLPQQESARYAASDKLPLLAADGSGTTLLWTQFSFASAIDKHIEIVDGRLPQPTTAGPVEVMITEALSAKAGFQPGEDYLVLGPKPNPTAHSQPVKIVGVWRAKDPADPYWFYIPNSFDDVLMLPEASFKDRIVADRSDAIYVALWYLVTDGSGIRSADVPAVGGHIQRTVAEISSILPGSRLDVSPLDALINHQRQVQRLTVTLTIFSVPIFGLIVYFVLLVAGLVVQRQSNEIAVLRSRGTSRTQIIVVYLFEALLLGVATLALGLLLGQVAALAMAWTRSFLTLEAGEVLPISLTREAWQRAFQMLALMIFASILPAFGAARYTIVSFRSERARATKLPLWQRAYFDLLLLVPVAYAYFLMRQSGPGVFGAADPFANPLLLLAPTLAIFALALVAVRLFPLLMRLIAGGVALLPGIAALTAFRSMARAPKLYTRPLLLMVLTLSLATFSASMAKTLDRHLNDEVLYQTGSTFRIADYGQSTQMSGPPGGLAAEQPAAKPEPDKLDEAQFLFLPVSEYLSVPGVQAATRVGRGSVNVSAHSQNFDAQFLGVDRADLAGAVRWRDDYAPESLGALMNRLADDPAAVLISNELVAKGMRVGDKLVVRMNDLHEPRDVPFTVVGYTSLFPTAYPEDGPLLIGNLDYAFEQQGGQFPYEVWMRLANGTTPEAVLKQLETIDLHVTTLGYAPALIQAEQQRPERQGVFGLLSVGFLAAALLTALGFLFYTLVMFQRRFVELGALRAIGLSTGQLGALLAWEQGTLIASGIAGGTLIGVLVSRAFIPFLQVRGGQHPLTPPFIVEIAWSQIGMIYMVFGAALALVTLLTMLLLRRMRLFEAVKMGEAV